MKRNKHTTIIIIVMLLVAILLSTIRQEAEDVAIGKTEAGEHA